MRKIRCVVWVVEALWASHRYNITTNNTQELYERKLSNYLFKSTLLPSKERNTLDPLDASFFTQVTALRRWRHAAQDWVGLRTSELWVTCRKSWGSWCCHSYRPTDRRRCRSFSTISCFVSFFCFLIPSSPSGSRSKSMWKACWAPLLHSQAFSRVTMSVMFF